MYVYFSVIYVVHYLMIRLLMLLATVIATVNQLCLSQCVLMVSPTSLHVELVVISTIYMAIEM